MRVFTVNLDEWGPLKRCCCGAESECIILDDSEGSQLPEDSGPNAVVFIYQNRLGVDRCVACARQMIAESPSKSTNMPNVAMSMSTLRILA